MGAVERTPYAGIDTGRYFTPPGTVVTYFTTEGVFGITTRGTTAFADPPCRKVLMESVFGSAVVASQVFGSNELPHGATISGDRVYFVVHAPHAVFATLILVTAAPPARRCGGRLPMSLTNDTLYWWCAVPLASAPAGTRYHFVLNDNLEVIDPAAREVRDSGGFDVPFNSDPNDEEHLLVARARRRAGAGRGACPTLADHGMGGAPRLRDARATVHRREPG